MSYTFTKKTINPKALKQSTHWFDKNGKEYKISQMSQTHAANCLGKLVQQFGLKAVISPLYAALEQRAKS